MLKLVDAMPTIDILFIIVISIMAVSVFLSIVDWVYLASLASKIVLLEREIEKKSLEFDAIKKERYAAQNSSGGSASVIESNEPLPDITESTFAPATGIEDTIQIVRNVRGNFQQEESFSRHIQDYSLQQPAFNQPSTLSGSAIEYTDSDKTVIKGVASQKFQDNRLLSSIESDRLLPTPPPPVGIVKPPETNSLQQKDACILKLFSDATRDADFHSLWKEITARLQTCQNPYIVIDMAGINFMYDKEMDYLEKIKYLLTSQGGSLAFINCDHELLALLNNRPQLRSIVQRKTV